MNRRRHLEFSASCFNVLDRWTKRGARSKIERKRDSRENSLVIDGKRRIGRLVVGKCAERNKLAGFRGYVDGFQGFRGTLHLGGDFHYDVVLIQPFINVGDLALTEGVAQSVVDILNGDAEA